jgi:dihydrodipicolinate reductase
VEARRGRVCCPAPETPRSGATTAAVMTKLKKCLVATRKGLSSDQLVNAEIMNESKIDDVLGGFAKKNHKAMKASAKDTTVVEVGFMGVGVTMTFGLAVAADESIRAVWMVQGFFE